MSVEREIHLKLAAEMDVTRAVAQATVFARDAGFDPHRHIVAVLGADPVRRHRAPRVGVPALTGPDDQNEW